MSTSGTYSVTVTDTNNCAATSSQVVTVLSLPTITANAVNDSNCLSTTVGISASGGLTYDWSPGNTLSDSLSASPTAGPVVTTTYTVVGTSAGGCSNTSSVTITVIGNPSVPTISKSNDTLYCSTTENTYQWYRVGTGIIPGATNQYYRYTVNGDYYVQVFNPQGCFTSSVLFTVLDIGINELNGSVYANAYPNPVTNELTLDLNIITLSDVKII